MVAAKLVPYEYSSLILVANTCLLCRSEAFIYPLIIYIELNSAMYSLLQPRVFESVIHIMLIFVDFRMLFLRNFLKLDNSWSYDFGSLKARNSVDLYFNITSLCAKRLVTDVVVPNFQTNCHWYKIL